MIRDRKRELFENAESDISKTEDDTSMGLSIRLHEKLLFKKLFFLFLICLFYRETESLFRSTTNCRQKCRIE